MKNSTKILIGIGSWAVIGLIALPPVINSCSPKMPLVESRMFDDGFLKGDDLVAVKSSDGKMSILNEATGKTTIKGIKIDWTASSPSDELSVFCSDDKRGYFNSYTGEVVIPAQYRRAWIFSEGLAAVQKNGKIGFIDHEGNTVIDFKFPYYGNSLVNFVFENGMCVVADSLGKCGIINKKGDWVIKPEYDKISTLKQYAIVSKEGVRMQLGYDGKIINSFVLDSIEPLTYKEDYTYVNKAGEVCHDTKEVKTGMFSYRVGGRCGMMDSDCRRLTEPLYASISAVDRNMFRAVLLDYFSEVIINAKGEVMK